MFKSTSTSLILLGILAVIVGIIAIAWPNVTILALVILFAVYAFMDAGLQGAQAFGSRDAGPVFGHLLLGLIDLAAGVIALVWPGPTAYVLVIVVGVWALVGGFAEVFAGFGGGETAGTRAMFIIAGLVSVAFGIVLLARPGVGEEHDPERDGHQSGDDEHRARARGLPAAEPGEDLGEAADKRPYPHHYDQDVRGRPGPDQGDHAGRQVDQPEQQVTEHRSGVTAAEGLRALQARVHERVDREQDDQRENRDVRPRDGDDPDDDGENAEQDQRGGC